MESLTRLVTESLARHGFDRPVDYRRLQWSRWFRCESHHSLLFVPSKPGVFALAEEVMNLSSTNAHVATGASPVPQSEASGSEWDRVSNHQIPNLQTPAAGSQEPEAPPRRMLAVAQFFEDDDMAFVLDRMLSRQNPMSSRMTSGRYFARFVVIADATQRRSICNALNQWIVNSAEKATGIGSHFASSLELTDATEYIAQPDPNQRTLFGEATVASALLPAAGTIRNHDASTPPALTAATTTYARQPGQSQSSPHAAPPPQLDSGAATNLHCPSPIPSGF